MMDVGWVRGAQDDRPSPPPATRPPVSPAPLGLAPLFSAAPRMTTIPTFPALTPPPTPAERTPMAGFTLGRDPIVMPVEGAKAADLHDSYAESRGTHKHEAIDIMAPRGTPVVAAVDGTIEKLFTSKPGGLTIYEFDRERNYCYYYAHLDRYAEDLKEGQIVHRNDRIGYVGSTGDASAEAPHLHFSILQLGPEKRWWLGSPINPYPLLLGK
jgi:murein DD-endopeptidase MepM/ murein hydrolase activator NlpD